MPPTSLGHLRQIQKQFRRYSITYLVESSQDQRVVALSDFLAPLLLPIDGSEPECRHPFG